MWSLGNLKLASPGFDELHVSKKFKTKSTKTETAKEELFNKYAVLKKQHEHMLWFPVSMESNSFD
jgi:hypothetical protein